VNAVEEIAIQNKMVTAADQHVATLKVALYIYGKKGRETDERNSPYALSDYSKDVVLLATSRALCRDVDLHFNRYVYRSPPPEICPPPRSLS